MMMLDGPERRRARKLLRRGETAEDVAVARYVVAYARECQRRFKQSSSFWWKVALGAAFGVGGIGFAAYLLQRSEQAQAIAMAVFSTLALVIAWRTWQTMRHVQTTEQLNQEYLRRSGAPYVPGGPPTPVDVPPLAFACSIALQVVTMFVVGGVLALLLRAESLSLAKVLSVGVTGGGGAALAAVIGVLVARSRRDDASGDSEYRQLSELD